MTGSRLTFGLALLLGGLLTPVAAEAQPAATIARIGYLSTNLAANPHTHERPSVKDCVTSVTSRVATS